MRLGAELSPTADWDAVVEAATSGEALPEFEDRVTKAEQAERAAQLRVHVFEQAVEQAALKALYSTEPSTIVRECLSRR